MRSVKDGPPPMAFCLTDGADNLTGGPDQAQKSVKQKIPAMLSARNCI